MATSTLKTFNRGRLLRLAQAGKLRMVGSYGYDELSGSDRQQGVDKPVAMKPADWKDRVEGTVYVREDDFRSSSGCAWTNENGTVTLIVHSNCNYTFRITE